MSSCSYCLRELPMALSNCMYLFKEKCYQNYHLNSCTIWILLYLFILHLVVLSIAYVVPVSMNRNDVTEMLFRQYTGSFLDFYRTLFVRNYLWQVMKLHTHERVFFLIHRNPYGLKTKNLNLYINLNPSRMEGWFKLHWLKPHDVLYYLKTGVQGFAYLWK